MINVWSNVLSIVHGNNKVNICNNIRFNVLSNIRNNVWINVQSNVQINVRNNIRNNVKVTKITHKQLEAAYELLEINYD
jgi:plasmid maintenance system antidote protein VapI